MSSSIHPTQALVDELLPSSRAIHDWHYLDMVLRIDVHRPLVRLLMHLVDPTVSASLDLREACPEPKFPEPTVDAIMAVSEPKQVHATL